MLVGFFAASRQSNEKTCVSSKCKEFDSAACNDLKLGSCMPGKQRRKAPCDKELYWHSVQRAPSGNDLCWLLQNELGSSRRALTVFRRRIDYTPSGIISGAERRVETAYEDWATEYLTHGEAKPSSIAMPELPSSASTNRKHCIYVENELNWACKVFTNIIKFLIHCPLIGEYKIFEMGTYYNVVNDGFLWCLFLANTS